MAKAKSTYVPPIRYTANQLTRYYLMDLARDAKCADRNSMPEYAAKCRAQIKALWPTRHSPKIDRYGIPS